MLKLISRALSSLLVAASLVMVPVAANASVTPGNASCELAGATLLITGNNFFGNAALWGVTQVLEPEAAEPVVTSSPSSSPAPYVGPLVTNFTPQATIGERVFVTGSRLSTVTSVNIDGVSIKVTDATENGFSFLLPAELSPGQKAITVVSAFGSLTSQGVLTVLENQKTQAQDLTAWTKLQPNGTVKVYAKNVVGAGKV